MGVRSKIFTTSENVSMSQITSQHHRVQNCHNMPKRYTSQNVTKFGMLVELVKVVNVGCTKMTQHPKMSQRPQITKIVTTLDSLGSFKKLRVVVTTSQSVKLSLSQLGTTLGLLCGVKAGRGVTNCHNVPKCHKSIT